MLKRKIETIPFREFLAGPNEKRMSHTPILYSLVPGMSIEGFFNMSPEVAGAYALVIGVGAIGMLSHVLEVNFAKAGFENISYVIEAITKAALPVGTYSFILYVFYKLMGGL